MKSEYSGEFEIVLSDAAEKYHDVNELLNTGPKKTVMLTAFVSCFNEQDFIVQTLEDICEAMRVAVESYEIIIIDDCSNDKSPRLIKEYIEKHPSENIIFRRNLVNRGLAQNFIDGAFLGKGEYYKLFCGDNTEPVESIVAICELAGKADIILPNYINVEGKRGFRLLLSSCYTFLINMVSGNRLKYYNGLHLHRRYNIMRWHPNTRGFGFQADIVCMLLDSGATFKEVSVLAVNRAPSMALNYKNVLSVAHTLIDIIIRRLAGMIYDKR